MLRLAMAAELAELSAEVGAMEADALLEGRPDDEGPGAGAGGPTPTGSPPA